jgi:hypothetical protein
VADNYGIYHKALAYHISDVPLVTYQMGLEVWRFSNLLLQIVNKL